MRALLDVNVLIALLDAAHIHHRLATRWLSEALDAGWATCPLTQIGCIRIMSQPAYPGARQTAEVAQRLADACKDGSHMFWSADVNPFGGQGLRWERVLGHRQLTDAYLLALAVKHGGRFVTFDRRITPHPVHGARADHLVTIA